MPLALDIMFTLPGTLPGYGSLVLVVSGLIGLLRAHESARPCSDGRIVVLVRAHECARPCSDGRMLFGCVRMSVRVHVRTDECCLARAHECARIKFSFVRVLETIAAKSGSRKEIFVE